MLVGISACIPAALGIIAYFGFFGKLTPKSKLACGLLATGVGSSFCIFCLLIIVKRKSAGKSDHNYSSAPASSVSVDSQIAARNQDLVTLLTSLTGQSSEVSDEMVFYIKNYSNNTTVEVRAKNLENQVDSKGYLRLFLHQKNSNGEWQPVCLKEPLFKYIEVINKKEIGLVARCGWQTTIITQQSPQLFANKNGDLVLTYRSIKENLLIFRECESVNGEKVFDSLPVSIVPSYIFSNPQTTGGYINVKKYPFRDGDSTETLLIQGVADKRDASGQTRLFVHQKNKMQQWCPVELTGNNYVYVEIERVTGRIGKTYLLPKNGVEFSNKPYELVIYEGKVAILYQRAIRYGEQEIDVLDFCQTVNIDERE